MQEIILLPVVMASVKAGEYFVGYCLGLSECRNTRLFYVLGQVFFDR